MTDSDRRGAATGPVILALFILVSGSALGGLAQAQFAGRLIDILDASRHEDHININIQFNCTMRYITHLPANSGTHIDIRFRPGSDCGLGAFFSGISELPSLAGASEYVKELRVETGAPGEVNLVLEWQKPATYVMAPTGDQRGFVIRIIDPPQKAHIYVQEVPIPDALFAVNLDSRTTPFTEAELAAAREQSKAGAYVSKILLDGTTWYRLRVGPVATRTEADDLLNRVQAVYPRSWLVIGEEEEAGPSGGVAALPPAAPLNPDPPLADAERADILAKARTALEARDFRAAVELLTVLVRQPEYAERALAQELLGLARERAGQLAHAKGEYEEYLRRYPNGEGAVRVRLRLKALALAGRKPRSQSGGSQLPLGWNVAGGVAQLYRRDQNNVTSTGTTFRQTSQNALINNADFLARDRGDRFDVLGRIYAGYTKSFLHGVDQSGDQTMINAAFVEATDKKLDLTARVGRQSRGSDGVFGTFDGAWVSYKVAPRVTVNATFGYPLDTLYQGLRTGREFGGLSADFGTFFNSWDFSAYAVEQKYAGHIDRRAVGLEARYFQPGRSLIALLDYDTLFKTLNSATVIGGVSLPWALTLSFNLDHRETPILTLRNALIGQPVASIDELLVNFTPDQVLQLARDRTARSDVYALTLTRPLSEKFQVSTDLYVTKIGATPASGNVLASPAGGTDRALQLQLFATSLYRSGDLHVVSVRYDSNPAAVTESIGLTSRLPIGSNWRLGPRLEVERIRYADQSTQMAYVPSLRLELLRSRTLFEFEVGADRARRDLQILADTQTSTQLYVSVGYRIGF